MPKIDYAKVMRENAALKIENAAVKADNQALEKKVSERYTRNLTPAKGSFTANATGGTITVEFPCCGLAAMKVKPKSKVQATQCVAAFVKGGVKLLLDTASQKRFHAEYGLEDLTIHGNIGAK